MSKDKQLTLVFIYNWMPILDGTIRLVFYPPIDVDATLAKIVAGVRGGEDTFIGSLTTSHLGIGLGVGIPSWGRLSGGVDLELTSLIDEEVRYHVEKLQRPHKAVPIVPFVPDTRDDDPSWRVYSGHHNPRGRQRHRRK